MVLTPSPNLSPYIFLGLHPSPPPLRIEQRVVYLCSMYSMGICNAHIDIFSVCAMYVYAHVYIWRACGVSMFYVYLCVTDMNLQCAVVCSQKSAILLTKTQHKCIRTEIWAVMRSHRNLESKFTTDLYKSTHNRFIDVYKSIYINLLWIGIQIHNRFT